MKPSQEEPILKLACIGDNCVDYYDNLQRYYLTGNAVDTAVNIAQQGMPCAIITTVAQDEYGEAMMAEFQRQNLDTSHVSRKPGKTAITHMELHGKERVHGDYEEGVMAEIQFSPQDISFAAGHKLVHSAYWGMAEDALKKIKALQPQTLVSYDFADRLETERVGQLKGVVDLGFFSYEAEDDWIKGYLAARVQEGMRVAVATFGDKGSLAYDGQSFSRFGIVPAELVNTIGAGDSFIAGFIVAYLRGENMEACLANGAKIASQVISVFGPWKE